MTIKPVTMATGTVTMAPTAGMFTIDEANMALPPLGGGLNNIVLNPTRRGGAVDNTTFYDKQF